MHLKCCSGCVPYMTDQERIAEHLEAAADQQARAATLARLIFHDEPTRAMFDHLDAALLRMRIAIEQMATAIEQMADHARE